MYECLFDAALSDSDTRQALDNFKTLLSWGIEVGSNPVDADVRVVSDDCVEEFAKVLCWGRV